MECAVLYCVFNRFDTVKQTFEPIRNIKPKRLYIASDGPRINNTEDIEIVPAVRKYILDNIDWDCQVNTLFREKNLGCDAAIKSAVDWFFDNEEMGIILEDDILASPQFFNFCEIMLDKYKDNDKVRSITARAISKDIDYKYDYTFIERSSTWGWATWKRTWNGFDGRMDKWPQYSRTCWLDKLFNGFFDYILDWEHIFTEHHKNKIVPWDFAFSFHNFLHVENGCYSITTTKTNLITNIGYWGYHYQGDSEKLGWEIDNLDTSNLALPPEVKIDYEYLNKCRNYNFDLSVKTYPKDYPDFTSFEIFKINTNYRIKIFFAKLKELLPANDKARERRKYRLARLNQKLYRCNRIYKIKHKK